MVGVRLCVPTSTCGDPRSVCWWSVLIDDDCHYIRVSASGHGIRSLNHATTVKAMCIDTLCLRSSLVLVIVFVTVPVSVSVSVESCYILPLLC